MSTARLLQTTRRVLATLALCATTTTGLVALDASASQAVPVAPRQTTTVAAASPALRTSAYEQQVQYWINVQRSRRGLGALTFAACADRYAETWGAHLASTGRFEHQSMNNILDGCGAYYAGETLGRGSMTPRYLVYLWMHSPEHRHVLLSPYAKRIGIGALPDSYGRWVVAADFLRY